MVKDVCQGGYTGTDRLGACFASTMMSSSLFGIKAEIQKQ